LDPGRRSSKPVTNRLSYCDTAIETLAHSFAGQGTEGEKKEEVKEENEK
jgi:hypothetical protein